MGNSKDRVFTVWDAGGHERIRPLWKSYARKAEGIIYVVDCTDKERLEEAKVELIKLLKSPETQGLPLVVLANKQDLPGSVDKNEVEKLLALKELPLYQLWHVEPTCGVTGEGLDEAIEVMAELIEKRKKVKQKR